MNIVSAADTPSLTTTIMKYEPQPAEPDQYMNAFIKLENVGTGTAKNVVLKVVPEFPFSLDEGQEDEKYIGSLSGGGSFYIAEFKLKISPDAVEGTNKLKVRYNIDENQNTWVEQELDISIQTGDALLSIEEILTEPTELVPGNTGKIKLTVKNLADSTLTNMKVSLDLSDEDLPFAPYNSATEKSIYQLNAGQSQEFVFDIITYPNAEAQVYKIPIDITYNDNVGNEYAKENLIGIIVNSEPDIKVTIDNTDLLKGKNIGTITLKIVNKGFNDVKFLNLKLTETDDFEVVSTSNEEYIGNLDSDDFETAEFTILIKNGNEVEIPLELEYKDMNNNPYTENLMVKLKIYSADELGQKSSSGAIWFVIIILAVAGFFVYKKWKKNKKKKSA
ncbi:MAG: COG1361 S-layer family protein [archaeon]